MEAATSSAARVSRGLPFPGRRRERAAGERIAALFEEHGRMVYGVCRLLLRDAVEAEDAAQQTFLSAYRALLAGQEPRDPSAWLGTIARNECRSRMRARRTEPLTLVTEPVGDELQREVARRQEVEALCTALAELPPQQRDAVVLREFYGLSYAEVAAALGLSGAAVESLLFRSRKRLQEQLRPVRSALGMLTLPVSLQESLAQALPGFAGGGASAGAGAAVLGKLASAPLVAKVAALALAVGTVGTVAGVERGHRARHDGVAAAPPAAVLAPPAPRRARADATPRARTVSFVVAKRRVSTPTQAAHASAPPSTAASEHESVSPRETEHERAVSPRETEHAGSTGTEHESGTGSHDSGASGATGATGGSGETEHSDGSGTTPPGD